MRYDTEGRPLTPEFEAVVNSLLRPSDKPPDPRLHQWLVEWRERGFRAWLRRMFHRQRVVSYTVEVGESAASVHEG